MRLGISSYTFTWAVGVKGYPPQAPMGPMALLQKAQELGVSVLQIIDNISLPLRPPAELVALDRHARQHGIALEVGTRGLLPENLITYLRIAQRLGSPIVRTLTDAGTHQPSVDEVVALVRDVLPEFERAQVCLAIENHDRIPSRGLAHIMRTIDSPYVGICLDTVNSFGALEGPEVVVSNLAPWVVGLHLKDFWVSRPPHRMGFIIEGRPAGRGRLDIPWLLDVLRKAGRDPNAILEIWTPFDGDLESTMAKEEAWALESVRYLRTLIPE